MELTENTLQVLKNYATINSNIVIEEGNTLRTISEAKNLLAKSEVDVNFPRTFGVYDLGEFLNVLGMMDSPSLKFEKDYVLINDGSRRSRVKYFYSDPEFLTRPTKDLIMPEGFDVTFTLDRSTLSRIKRASSILGHTEMSLTRDGDTLVLSVIDNNDETSNAFSIDVDGETNVESDFNYVFNINNLKMIDGDYTVNISSKLISQFVNKESSNTYWIALEKSSTC